MKIDTFFSVVDEAKHEPTCRYNISRRNVWQDELSDISGVSENTMIINVLQAVWYRPENFQPLVFQK
jgi:hypothetical protein